MRGRGAGREAGGRAAVVAQLSGMHGGRPDSRLLGARARAERTRNMLAMFVTMEVSRLSGWLKACAPENILYMVVTLEVSQLEMSALKFPKFKKSQFMSMIIETSQPAMEPYVSVAAPGLVLYACTAVCREALVVKVAGQVPEPQPEP